jgi:UDP-3-O-[3-hydroxymyristoyl] glucosamine N-acyltransferase
MTNTIETVEDDAGNVHTYRRHPNGGGLIGRGAKASQTAFIRSTAYVESGPDVGCGCRIGAGSWVDRKVRIGDYTVIGATVYIARAP